jgi:hypothetical protein
MNFCGHSHLIEGKTATVSGRLPELDICGGKKKASKL